MWHLHLIAKSFVILGLHVFFLLHGNIFGFCCASGISSSIAFTSMLFYLSLARCIISTIHSSIESCKKIMIFVATSRQSMYSVFHYDNVDNMNSFVETI